ncbi:HlyD family efflux transporter periplasmic adaptor subunit [Bradyrhizobium sp. YCK136]|uniref:HlyD family efflux transporter periplasmic adaptor subunit n=1 Tax=Bradyrhizobium TaxID=374 RepID=UPI0020128DC0|nr:HlyD family efflux transporter periplasmic adaptor subunit [Bradyrhizobium diazoefficiens]
MRKRRPFANWSWTKSSDQRALGLALTTIGARVPAVPATFASSLARSERSKLKEAEAAFAAIKETRDRTAAEFKRTLYDELAKAEQEAAGIAQDVIKADLRTKLQDLVAPVDGVVQQLAVHTVGGVVTPAQVLAVVVSQDSHLEIEAMLSNDDVGFIQAGQEAEIKVHTFNFTRYGVLYGKVLSVSPDTIARDGRDVAEARPRAQNPSESGQQQGPDDLVYAAGISLDQRQLTAGGSRRRSRPGHGGHGGGEDRIPPHHRLSALLLSPLARYEHHVLRER